MSKITNQDLTMQKNKITAKQIRINAILKEVRELRKEIIEDEAKYEEMEAEWLSN